MKILKVITGLGVGGAEKQLCLLSDHLSSRGHQVTIVSLVGEKIISPDNKDISVIQLQMNKNLFGFIFSFIKLSVIFFKYKPQIIHAHMFHANIMSRIAAFFTFNCSRLICTAHNKNEGGKLRMLAYRLTDFLCSTTTNVSEEALDNFFVLKAFSKSKSIMVYNGIDFSRFSFNASARDKIRQEFLISEDEKLIISVGRLTEAKDYPNFLHALNQLTDNKLRILIIGEGELRPELEKLVYELNLQSKVTLVGVRMDIQDFYSAADLFVLSSRWEGFGLVVAEAMGSLCSVVATNSGGVSEVVGNEEFIVPINDSIALSKKISKILSLSKESKEIILERNYQHVINNFSIEKIIDQWLGIYLSKVKV